MRWTSSQLAQLHREYPQCDNPRDLAGKMGVSYSAMKCRALKEGLKRAFNAKRTDILHVHDQFIRDNYLSIPVKGMVTLIGRSSTYVKSRMTAMNLVVPREITEQRIAASRIKPGNVPLNKGKTMPEAIRKKVERTWYRKGHLPHNTKADGVVTTRIDTKTGLDYQYLRIGLAKWVLLHRHIWEQHHGAVPKGYVIAFKNGNRMDCNIENLQMITLQENMKRNSYHNYGKEIAQLVQLRGVLTRQINKHTKQLAK